MTTVIKGDSNINLDFSTGGRITGDFSNATIANRVAFQTSTTNGNTVVGVLTNGTGTTAALQVSNNSDITAALAFGNLQVSSSEVSLQSGIRNAGSYIPMTFYTGGSERMRVDTSGNVGIGTSSPAARLNVVGGRTFLQANNETYSLGVIYGSGKGQYYIGATDSLTPDLVFSNVAGTERMRLDSSGNVGIGTSSPGAKLDVSGNLRFSAANPVIELNNGGAQVYSTVANTLQFASGGGIGSPTETARITAAGLFQFNSGYGSVATAYGCRAWINFNGTGTPAIRGSGNFSSITDNGTGDYTLNFTTSLPDTNYCPVVGGDFSQGATRDNGMYLPTNFTFATSSLRISVTNYAGAYTDIDTVLVSIFR